MMSRAVGTRFHSPIGSVLPDQPCRTSRTRHCVQCGAEVENPLGTNLIARRSLFIILRSGLHPKQGRTFERPPATAESGRSSSIGAMASLPPAFLTFQLRGRCTSFLLRSRIDSSRGSRIAAAWWRCVRRCNARLMAPVAPPSICPPRPRECTADRPHQANAFSNAPSDVSGIRRGSRGRNNQGQPPDSGPSRDADP
jgi:hypothetical protein